MAERPAPKPPETSTKKIRSKIQEAIDAADAERKRELFRRRIEIARAGLKFYDLHKSGEAVKQFQIYLRILEEFKDVGEGRLTPKLFDPKKDQHELLLLSGVYWDLAKLYDRTKSPQKRKMFNGYLEKFVAFSKGMHYQPLCAETLRKYISNDKPVHREEFRFAYTQLAESKCFVATSLVDHVAPETVPALRAFRDEVLAASAAGRTFVSLYYRVGPGIARLMDRAPERARRAAARALDFAGEAYSRTVPVRPGRK